MNIKKIINQGLALGKPEKDIAKDCVSLTGCSFNDAFKAIDIYKYLLA
jgi:hypothetical protein